MANPPGISCPRCYNPTVCASSKQPCVIYNEAIACKACSKCANVTSPCGLLLDQPSFIRVWVAGSKPTYQR